MIIITCKECKYQDNESAFSHAMYNMDTDKIDEGYKCPFCNGVDLHIEEE